MTCAKRIVRCTIITREGFAFTGENACSDPQPVCPRKEGEGYKKCKSVCRQEGHAEIQALTDLLGHQAYTGHTAKGALAVITGIDHLCKECARALTEAGIDQIILRRTL